MTEDCEQVRKIFVGGLNRTTDDEALEKFFSPWGDIVDHTVMRDVQGVSRGFGFVTFSNSEPVDNLMKAKREGQKFTLDTVDVEIKRAFPKSSGSFPGEKLRDAVNRTRKIFVGGIPSTTSESDLRQYFCKFGTVNEVEILYDKVTSRMRGFAFVTFEDEDAADKVCQVREHKIKMKNCEVKKAESRSAIKMRNERQMGGGGGPPRGGYQFNHGGGNMPEAPKFGGGGMGSIGDLSSGISNIATLQALGLTGAILQNLLTSGAINQGQLQNAIGGIQGNRQGNFGNQQNPFGGGNFGGNLGGNVGGGGGGNSNPLQLLNMIGNMGGQLGNLLNLAGLAGLASGGGSMSNQNPNAGGGPDSGDQYLQSSCGTAGSQPSTGIGNANSGSMQDSNYGYGYGYNMGSYSPQQSGYGPMKYQTQGSGSMGDKKSYRPY